MQESGRKGMEVRKGEGLSLEVQENGWLGLRECVRAKCRWSSAKFVFFLSLFLFLAIWGEGDK